MPPPSSGEGAAMSAEERRKVEQLVALSPGCGNDGALHVLRECRGDVQAAAVHLLESAWPLRSAAARRTAAAEPATTEPSCVAPSRRAAASLTAAGAQIRSATSR